MSTAPASGQSYAPRSKRTHRVVQPGEYVFAVACLDHGHIYGQTNGLLEAGGTLKAVYDPHPERLDQFLKTYPESGVRPVERLEDILEDPEIQLVAAAAVPSERGPLGCRVMEAGKDYFTDKCPFTTLEQLESARRVAGATARKYMVYYSERLHVEAAIHTGQLIHDGAIGEIVHMSIMGPHRLGLANRPEWFFIKDKYGGILTDICSHQFDQFLYYTDSRDAEILHARIANFSHPDYPEFEDFGEAILKLDTGASCHSRVDWYTPDGLSTWGDGRTFIVGTRGYIEVRKYVDVARDRVGDRIYLVDQQGESLIDCHGQVGFPFFGEFILDCLNRTEKAMTQDHAFKAAELSLMAQQRAEQAGG